MTVGGAVLEVMQFDFQSSCVPGMEAKPAFMLALAKCSAVLRSLPIS